MLKRLQNAYKKEFTKADKNVKKLKDKKNISMNELLQNKKDIKIAKAIKKSDFK